MTNPIYFFVYPRGGSCFFLKMLQGRPLSPTGQNDGCPYAEDGYLCTMPPRVCPTVHLAKEVDPLTAIRDCLATTTTPSLVFYNYVWNWWGERSDSDQVPAPYEGESINRWGREELVRLPGNIQDWQFVTLVRDPRNHIESVRWTKGERDSEFQQRDRLDYFRMQCLGARNRLRVVADCLHYLPNYRVVKFEDLVAAPALTVSLLIQRLGLQPDDRALIRTAEIEAGSREADQHSSFGQVAGCNQRWHRWTVEEVAVFKEVVGQELIELGYEIDENWQLPG